MATTKSKPVDLEAIKSLDNLTTEEAAAYCRQSRSTFEKLRHFGGGPCFIRLSARAIIYRRTDLDAWLAAKARNSTSDYAGQAA
ncbi:AlpA family transcriptional regulator [Aliihoeflea sp. 40Bstr573]|uniref:helix-turn-helix transcriptional regulator n=1 Tax=Aliihoeflea sp. 40Bstr573 TaxID=2696467 RepID=UPI0020940A33|nr:helix-turn-helix domain-containing protein [Aliihoeflea sp. 40Bstr573]MCO6387932.1 helix-turn-helix domain-containing protein [Aliihoeflea sp. 40Bstr573]